MLCIKHHSQFFFRSHNINNFFSHKPLGICIHCITAWAFIKTSIQTQFSYKSPSGKSILLWILWRKSDFKNQISLKLPILFTFTVCINWRDICFFLSMHSFELPLTLILNPNEGVLWLKHGLYKIIFISILLNNFQLS